MTIDVKKHRNNVKGRNINKDNTMNSVIEFIWIKLKKKYLPEVISIHIVKSAMNLPCKCKQYFTTFIYSEF